MPPKKVTKPTFKPTDDERKLVEQMTAVGIPQESVCRIIRGGIDDKTLRKHFRDELDTALIKANAKVSGMLYNNCMSGKERSIEWWEKTRQGRKETSVHENTGEQIHVIKWEGVE
jgi:hypothetical protein|tara:strand:- start:220 stop:564 length:345 start_codon:yes stop_codon:yes gene_type:complete